ncbi:MAG: hypothetical protein WBC91_14095 [Phototrophicaceae bacterium]
MNWLQNRLDELNYTHKDLQKRLAAKGINRVRETITGWTNGKAVSLLNNPKHAQMLAETLNWSVLEMFVAAGYNVSIPRELLMFTNLYRTASEERQKRLWEGLQFVTGFYGSFTDDELDNDQ